jgi:hypothetical protein
MRRDTEHDQYDGRRDLGLGGKCQPYRKAFRAITQADSKLCGDPYVAALSRKSFISSSSICLFSPLSEGVLTSVLLFDLESKKEWKLHQPQSSMKFSQSTLGMCHQTQECL